MRVDGRIGQLVEAASELDNEALFLHARDSRGGDASRGKLGGARDAARLEEFDGTGLLCRN